MALADDVDRRAARRAVALDFGDVAEVRNDRAANGANVPTGLAEGKRLKSSGLHRVSTVTFRSSGADLNADAAWRALCTRIYCDLRGYLMGQSGPPSDGV